MSVGTESRSQGSTRFRRRLGEAERVTPRIVPARAGTQAASAPAIRDAPSDCQLAPTEDLTRRSESPSIESRAADLSSSLWTHARKFSRSRKSAAITVTPEMNRKGY